MEKYKYIKLFSIKNTPIQMHWSLAIALIAASLYGISNQFFLIGAIAFFLIMFIHELGHMYFAKRYGLETHSINLFILHGVCLHEEAETDYENYIVAWGGVAFQVLFALPALALFFIFESVLPKPVNTFLVFFSMYNIAIAVFNLIPVQPLDGASCWKSIPLYFKYSKKKKKKSHLKVVSKK